MEAQQIVYTVEVVKMIGHPPPNITVNDIWVAGLILAGIVWIETFVIVWLIFKYRFTEGSLRRCKNSCQQKS